MLPVAVDAVGGDKAPGEIVAGARRALDELGVPVLLVGPPDRMGDPLGLDVLACTEVIEMTDDPGSSVRRKKDSSLVRAAEAVRDGKASAMVSAGNTGATMASALLRMGRIKGVSRPAIAIPVPVPGTTPTILLDAGANAEVQPEWLVQFAQMGAAFFTARFGGDGKPRVGLLSIGEEDSKGRPQEKETNALLRGAANVNFIGNVEGRDLMTPDVDVVVTDGFTGNVVLKTMEGEMRFVQKALVERIPPELFEQLWPHLEPLILELDPETYGGAMLLGVDGVCIISHGSASARAITNACAVARDMVEGDLVGHLRQAVGTT